MQLKRNTEIVREKNTCDEEDFLCATKEEKKKKKLSKFKQLRS